MIACRWNLWRPCGVAIAPVLLLSLGISAGCSRTDDAEISASGRDGRADPPPAAGVADPSPVDPLAYPVPDVPADQLLDFINEMAMQPPRGETDEDRTADLGRLMDARIEAAERILEKSDDDQYHEIAIQTKLESMRLLASIGRDGAESEFVAYARQLAKDENHPSQARWGRLGLFQSQVDRATLSPNGDPQSVVTAIQQLLAEETCDRYLFDVLNESVEMLSGTGASEAATAAARILGQAFADHEDETLALAAADVRDRANGIHLEQAFEQFMRRTDGAAAQLLQTADEILGEAPSPATLGLVMDVAQRTENAAFLSDARQLYQWLEAALARLGKEDDATALIQSGLDRARVRLELVGQAIELTGQTKDGTPLDWSRYQDKVVLVEFWATWCGPCIAELPNIRENYDKYHTQGFEVLGVNLDEDPAAVEAFLADQQLPWDTIVGDGLESGSTASNAARYGVETIPFALLIGRDGTVDAIHVRGQRLNEKLAELMSVGVSPTSPAESLQGLDLSHGEASASDDSIHTPLTPDETPPAGKQTGVDESRWTDDDQAINPYAPETGWSVKELVAFLSKMQDKTASIQYREGFRAGICLAADRILQADSPQHLRVVAAEAKLNYLHRDACLGDETADRLLRAAASELREEKSDEIQRLVTFLEHEQRAVLAVDQQDVPDELINQLTAYLESEQEELTSRHLRLASSLVELINRLEDLEERQKRFDELGALLATSSDKQLARYGRRIGGPQDASAAGQKGNDRGPVPSDS